MNIARDTGSYQASFLTFISDYALGYQVLRDSDSETATRYADKAISMIRSGLHDYQKGSSVASQFAGRGNGQTRTFTLPDADIVPETMVVGLAPVTMVRVVHGARPFGIDTLPDSVFYSKILKVSRTPDGLADFRQGLDWRRNRILDWVKSTGPWAATLPRLALFITSPLLPTMQPVPFRPSPGN